VAVVPTTRSQFVDLSTAASGAVRHPGAAEAAVRCIGAAEAVRCTGTADAVMRAQDPRLAAARAVSAGRMTSGRSAVLRPIGIVLAAPPILRRGESCRGASPKHEQRYA
jgi:hypothetical protein